MQEALGGTVPWRPPNRNRLDRAGAGRWSVEPLPRWCAAGRDPPCEPRRRRAQPALFRDRLRSAESVAMLRIVDPA